jgi:hypothetical protein
MVGEEVWGHGLEEGHLAIYLLGRDQGRCSASEED